MTAMNKNSLPAAVQWNWPNLIRQKSAHASLCRKTEMRRRARKTGPAGKGTLLPAKQASVRWQSTLQHQRCVPVKVQRLLTTTALILSVVFWFFVCFFYLNTQVLFPAKMLGRNSFLGVAVRRWLALLPKAVGAPSLEVPSDTDGQPELLGGQPAHSRGWDSMGFKVPSNPTHSMKKFLKSTGIPGPQPQRQQCPNSILWAPRANTEKMLLGFARLLRQPQIAPQVRDWQRGTQTIPPKDKEQM